MLSVSEIKAAILKAAGYPEAGPIADFAEEMAKEVSALLSPPSADKETRVSKPSELR